MLLCEMIGLLEISVFGILLSALFSTCCVSVAFPFEARPKAATTMGYSDFVIGKDQFWDRVVSSITGKRAGEAR